MITHIQTKMQYNAMQK